MVGGHFPTTTRNLREHEALSRFSETTERNQVRCPSAGHMGDVDISLDEGEDVKVDPHNNRRFLLRRLRVNDLQRHLVATWPNCSCGKQRLGDASFLLVLKVLFLFCLSWSLTATFGELYIAGSFDVLLPWRDRIFNLTLPGIVFLGLFAAIFVLIVLVWMKSRPSSEERRVEVKTISGDMQPLLSNDELSIKS